MVKVSELRNWLEDFGEKNQDHYNRFHDVSPSRSRDLSPSTTTESPFADRTDHDTHSEPSFHKGRKLVPDPGLEDVATKNGSSPTKVDQASRRVENQSEFSHTKKDEESDDRADSRTNVLEGSSFDEEGSCDRAIRKNQSSGDKTASTGDETDISPGDSRSWDSSYPPSVASWWSEEEDFSTASFEHEDAIDSCAYVPKEKTPSEDTEPKQTILEGEDFNQHRPGESKGPEGESPPDQNVTLDDEQEEIPATLAVLDAEDASLPVEQAPDETAPYREASDQRNLDEIEEIEGQMPLNYNVTLNEEEAIPENTIVLAVANTSPSVEQEVAVSKNTAATNSTLLGKKTLTSRTLSFWDKEYTTKTESKTGNSLVVPSDNWLHPSSELSDEDTSIHAATVGSQTATKIEKLLPTRAPALDNEGNALIERECTGAIGGATPMPIVKPPRRKLLDPKDLPFLRGKESTKEEPEKSATPRTTIVNRGFVKSRATRKKMVQRRKEELEQQWAENNKVATHVKKIKWGVCEKTGVYKKKVVLDVQYT